MKRTVKLQDNPEMPTEFLRSIIHRCPPSAGVHLTMTQAHELLDLFTDAGIIDNEGKMVDQYTDGNHFTDALEYLLEATDWPEQRDEWLV